VGISYERLKCGDIIGGVQSMKLMYGLITKNQVTFDAKKVKRQQANWAAFLYDLILPLHTKWGKP